MTTDYTAPPPTPQPSFPLTAPVRLTGRDKREAVTAYRVYLAGGADAWDAYDALRAEGYSPALASWHAKRTARAVAP